MTLIIMQDENLPKDYQYEGNVILQPMECQQSKIDKKPLYGQCSLKSGGLTKVRTGDW
jgi:hypothetical protein